MQTGGNIRNIYILLILAFAFSQTENDRCDPDSECDSGCGTCCYDGGSATVYGPAGCDYFNGTFYLCENESICFESLEGTYTVNDSNCYIEQSEYEYEEHYVHFGGDQYFEEIERSYILTGFPVEPAHDYNAQSQADCEEAAQGAPWWCQNDMGGGGGELVPCNEAYFDQECWNNLECIWLYAECTPVPNEFQEACYEDADGGPINDETTCESNPGCQWESGYDDWGNYNGQQPHCYFNCVGLSESVCGSIPTECDWVPGAASGYSYCQFSLLDGTTGPGECNTANEALMMANQGDCWWEPDDPSNFQGPGICQCNPWDWETPWETACTALGPEFEIVTETEPDYCDWHHEVTDCDSYTDPATCQADYENHCMWDDWMWNDDTQSQGICYQDIWYSDGVSCLEMHMQNEEACTADENCDWYNPGEDSGNPDWAQEGLCINFDPCHYEEQGNPWGYQNQNDCENDPFCQWEEGEDGLPGGCYENEFEQWCECRYEYTQETCMHPMFWESSDDSGGQCMYPMDQWSCEYGDIGPGDGYIDCSEYEDYVEWWKEWNPSDSTCTVIENYSIEGSWNLDEIIIPPLLCLEAEGNFGPVDCDTIDTFEECECADCQWNGEGDPMQDPWKWENNGECVDNDDGDNQTDPWNIVLTNKCWSFISMDNSDIHLTYTHEDSSTCTVVLNRLENENDATWANLIVFDDLVIFDADGYVGGVQMTLLHDLDFSINVTDFALVAECNTSQDRTTCVIVAPETEELFSYTGNMTISESIIVNSQDYVEHEIIYFTVGDVNFDGIIDILDIVITVSYIVGTLELNELQTSAADYNGDGTIDVLDVVLILNFVLEL